MPNKLRVYCCDSLKSHRRHIYSYLQLVPSKMIAEHPSVALRSGHHVCCNCLKAICWRSPEVSNLGCAGPSSYSHQCASLRKSCSDPSNSVLSLPSNPTDNHYQLDCLVKNVRGTSVGLILAMWHLFQHLSCPGHHCERLHSWCSMVFSMELT